jgi:hypothetical protein
MSAGQCCSTWGSSVAIEDSDSPNVAAAGDTAAAAARFVAEESAVGHPARIQRSNVPERLVLHPLWRCGRTGHHTSSGQGWWSLGPRQCYSKQYVLLSKHLIREEAWFEKSESSGKKKDKGWNFKARSPVSDDTSRLALQPVERGNDCRQLKERVEGEKKRGAPRRSDAI